MASPTLGKSDLWRWKRFALKWFAVGSGFAVASVVLVFMLIWYSSRPKPPKPWNTTALTAHEAPGFEASRDAKKLEFTFMLENATEGDYHLESDAGLIMMIRNRDGSLSRPIPRDIAPVDTPVFVPSHQKGVLGISLALGEIPQQNPGESDDDYHERIRSFCNERLDGVAGFVLFDEENRYQINLPGWVSERQKGQAVAQRAAQEDPNAPFVGATKAYRGFTYRFDGRNWLKGTKALKWTPSGLNPTSEDQYDPLGLLSKDEKAKRTLTETQIRVVAQRFGVSYEEAREEASQQGYQVPK
jgi:hypothetical protein